MGSMAATAETSNAFYQGAPSLESTKVNSNRVHEFVQDVSSMPDNNPSPNFSTKKPRKVATQAITVKDFIPRGSERNIAVCVPRIWENMDQEQNVSELGFIVVEQVVPSEH